MIVSLGETLGSDEFAKLMDAPEPTHFTGSVSAGYGSTNAAGDASMLRAFPVTTRVDRAISFMMTHYEDLLRRLADSGALDSPSYLSEAEIVELHDRIIGRTGGMAGIRDAAALESCVAQPKTAVFQYVPFRTVSAKAAAYCFFIVRFHPFFDGNKRTGLSAAVTFLLDNGVTPSFDADEMYELIIAVARREAEIEDLTSLFEKASLTQGGEPI